MLRKIERTDDLSPVFHRLARHPKIVSTWQNVIGDEDLLLFRSTLMLKPAHHGSAHALHQDAAVRYHLCCGRFNRTVLMGMSVTLLLLYWRCGRSTGRCALQARQLQ